MALTQSQPLGPGQRVQVEWESYPGARRVKIRLEHYAAALGWYTAASLRLPRHQLPLLEQALNELRATRTFQDPGTGNIIPFPGLANAALQ